MKIVTLTENAAKQGTERWSVSLSPEVRGQFQSDVLRRASWAQLCDDFDRQLLGRFNDSSKRCLFATQFCMQPFRFAPHLLAQNSSAASSTAQPLQDTAADTATTWPDEVTTLQQLAETYDIEYKIPARQPGVTIYITKAVNRSGNQTDIVEGQMYKVFLATWSSRVADHVLSTLKDRI